MAETYSQGNGSIGAMRLRIGQELRQQKSMNVLYGHSDIVTDHLCLQHLEIVGSLAPPVGGHQVVVSLHFAFGSLDILGSQGFLIGFLSLSLVPQALQDTGTIKIESGPLLVDIILFHVGVMAAQLQHAFQAVGPFAGLTIVSGLNIGVDDGNETDDASGIAFLVMVSFHHLLIVQPSTGKVVGGFLQMA